MEFFFWLVIVVALVAFMIWLSNWESEEKLKRLGPLGEGITASDISIYGDPQPAFVCPHCQKKGKVLTKQIKKKAGISGGKATGAILTGGISLLATGLSRKDELTQAHCVNCNSTWHF